MRALILAFVLAACATAPAAVPADAAAVVAAERAFAARAGEIGWVQAFREYTAQDGQIARDRIVSAPESLADAPDGGRLLYWEPAYAGIARSGDLGFSTGPYSFEETRIPRGQYFTVWRRQPDGSWRWIWDGGLGPVAEPGPMRPADYAVPSLPVAESGVGAARARAEVEALERALTGASLASHLAPDAHVYRFRQPRAYGGEASAAAALHPSAEIAYDMQRLEVSEAGDLAFTLGETRWQEAGQAREGFFARIWQYRGAKGWRVVYDQMAPKPPPPAN